MTIRQFNEAIQTLLSARIDDSDHDGDEYYACVRRAEELGLSIGKFEEEK